MRIRTILGIAVSVAMVLVLGLTAATWTVNARLDDISADRLKAQQVNNGIADLLALTYEYATYAEARPQRQWRKHHAELVLLLENGASHTVPLPADLLDEAKSLADIFERLVDARATPGELRERQVNLLVSQLISTTQTVNEAVNRWTASLEEIHQQTQLAYYRLALGTPVLMLAMLLLLSALLISRVLRPLSKLHRAVQAVAQGDLTVRSSTAANDEFGELSRAFDAMAVDLVGSLRLEISERAKAAQALAEREADLSEAQRIAHVGSWRWDARTDQNLVTPELCRIYGQDEIPPFAEQCGSMYPAETWQALNAAVQQAVRTGIGYDLEIPALHGGRLPIWVNTRCHPVFDAAGEVIGLRGTVQDITEHKQKEQALRQFKAIVDSTDDAIIGKTLDGNITSWNHGAERLFGYTAAEVIGRSMRLLIPPDRANEEGEILARIAHGERIEHFETVRVRKDGRSINISATISPIADAAGKVIGASKIARDITERMKVDNEIRRSNAELEQFSYAISHDMRQPLRMIASYLKLLDAGLGDQLDAEKREFLNFAKNGARRLDQMLVGLLEYSRVGRKGEPPVWLESRDMLDEALLFLRPAIEEAQARVAILGDWPRVFVSRDEIQRLLQNLVGNAVKFRLPGRLPEIVVTSEAAQMEWRFSVVDNGAGMIPDQMDRLFQVFQRLHGRTAYEGTGIGLALCRKIVEHHHGRIWAESAGEGQGSRFCVALPQQQVETQ